MGNRGKSWYSALMQGLQTLTWFSVILLIFVLIYNYVNGYHVAEYIYLLVPIFLVGLLTTYRYTYNQMKIIVRHLLLKRRK